MKTTRRTLVRGAAWAVPSVVASATIPAYAASPIPVLSSVIWFSGRGTTTNYTSTCSVPEMTSATGACGATTSAWPWRNRFQFYATDDAVYSDAGSCVRDSKIDITNLTAAQLTGPITLTFWRPENLDTTNDIRTWYRGANDSGLWTVPTSTGAVATPFGGAWAGVKMYEYKTTLSLADARKYMVSDGKGGVSLKLTKSAGAAMSFFSDCMPFDSNNTQADLDAFNRLGRYVLTVPTAKGNLTKDTGFYTS